MRIHVDFGINSAPYWYQPPYVYIGGDSSYQKFLGGLIGTLYNLSYVIIINLILQAVYSSLIMDTFGAMRDEADKLLDDTTSKCFICSIDRDEFEQVGLSFNDHIINEHNVWKYLFFKIYLDLKDPLSFSGPEHFAFAQMKDKQTFIKLLPIKRSLSLERKSTQEGEGVSLESLNEAIHALESQQTRLLEMLRLRKNEESNDDGSDKDEDVNL